LTMIRGLFHRVRAHSDHRLYFDDPKHLLMDNPVVDSDVAGALHIHEVLDELVTDGTMTINTSKAWLRWLSRQFRKRFRIAMSTKNEAIRSKMASALNGKATYAMYASSPTTAGKRRFAMETIEDRSYPDRSDGSAYESDNHGLNFHRAKFSPAINRIDYHTLDTINELVSVLARAEPETRLWESLVEATRQGENGPALRDIFMERINFGRAVEQNWDSILHDMNNYATGLVGNIDLLSLEDNYTGDWATLDEERNQFLDFFRSLKFIWEMQSTRSPLQWADFFDSVKDSMQSHMSRIEVHIQGPLVREVNARKTIQSMLDRLNFGVASLLNKEPVDVHALIDEALSLVPNTGLGQRSLLDREGADMEIQRNFDPQVGKFEVERGKIVDVLVNLLKNANEEMGERDGQHTLLIETRLVSDNNEPTVEIVVTDSGNGISPEIIGEIFDKRFTTKDGGRIADVVGQGIGLFGAKQIVSAHGGKLLAESEGEGKGAVFKMRLPVGDVAMLAGDRARIHHGIETVAELLDSVAFYERRRSPLRVDQMTELDEAAAEGDRNPFLGDPVANLFGIPEVRDALNELRAFVFNNNADDADGWVRLAQLIGMEDTEKLANILFNEDKIRRYFVLADVKRLTDVIYILQQTEGYELSTSYMEAMRRAYMRLVGRFDSLNEFAEWLVPIIGSDSGTFSRALVVFGKKGFLDRVYHDSLAYTNDQSEAFVNMELMEAIPQYRYIHEFTIDHLYEKGNAEMLARQEGVAAPSLEDLKAMIYDEDLIPSGMRPLVVRFMRSAKIIIAGMLGENLTKEIYPGVDHAMLVAVVPAPVVSETPGGIDFNPNLLNLQIKRNGRGVPLPVEDQNFQNINVEGFIPVIINITPITNLPLILGSLQGDFQDLPTANAEGDPFASLQTSPLIKEDELALQEI